MKYNQLIDNPKVRQIQALICKLTQFRDKSIIIRSRLNNRGIEEKTSYIHILEKRKKELINL